MKTCIVIILIVFGRLSAYSENGTPESQKKIPSKILSNLIIDAGDTIVFDLANATLTSAYIDIPIYLVTDDMVNSFDYAIRFNLSKLTFSTTIDILPSDSTIISLAHFNDIDLFLRFTSSSLQGYPVSGTHLTTMRFLINTPCSSLSAADFMDGLAIINGIQCSWRVTDFDPSKYIPSAGFMNGISCTDQGIQFTDTSSVLSGSIEAWSWNFDNGQTDVSANPLVTYSIAGAGIATLIVTASSGCGDTIVQPFMINPAPVSAFSYSFNCIKDSLLFTNTSAIPSGVILKSLWDFGDSSTDTLLNPSHHYPTQGNYIVTLLSTSDFSCTSTSTLQVSQFNNVTANFTTSTGNNCIGSSISFSDASTYSVSSITAWTWDFGDGSTSNLQNPAYSYSLAGTYSVTLTSYDEDGCQNKTAQSVIIHALPVVLFSITSSSTCVMDTVSFTNLTQSGDGSSYFWIFGDGSSSTDKNPVYSYTTDATYIIKLTVTSEYGCVDTLSKTHSVSFPYPSEAPFTNTVISTANVAFTNLTPNSAKTIWDFGDNQSSSQLNASHTFPAIGTYRVCLMTYNNLSCFFSSCQDIYVGMSRVVAVPSCFTPNDDNTNDELKVKGGPLLEMQFMIFNQWGNLIFSSGSQDFGWDGNYNGEPQPTGAYEYVLKGRTADNIKVNLYGIVNLIR